MTNELLAEIEILKDKRLSDLSAIEAKIDEVQKNYTRDDDYCEGVRLGLMLACQIVKNVEKGV